MATTKTTTRKAVTKPTTSTKGKTATSAKTVVKPGTTKTSRTSVTGRYAVKRATPASAKTAKPMTTNEALMIAWQHDYETRHGKAKRK